MCDANVMFQPGALRKMVAHFADLQVGAVSGDVRVAKPLTPGLNREAIRAVRRWRFAPGRIEGRAVPVQVSIETTFALR